MQNADEFRPEIILSELFNGIYYDHNFSIGKILLGNSADKVFNVKFLKPSKK
jgi:hypothetical protein